MQDYIKSAPRYRKRRFPWGLFLLTILLIIVSLGRIAVQNDISRMANYYEDIIISQEQRIEYLEIQLRELGAGD